MRPSGYSSTIPFCQSSHMMMCHGAQHHGGYYGSHSHVHGHHGHIPHDSTNFSTTTSMVHSDGGNGSGMQLSSHAHMSSMAIGHHGHGGYSKSQNLNWALNNLDD
ncbi:unnamed protein product [Withania somnifera]